MKRISGITLLIISITIAVSFLLLPPKGTRAETASSDYGIQKKLDTILSNQKAILDALASVKQELEVIRIRVTR